MNTINNLHLSKVNSGYILNSDKRPIAITLPYSTEEESKANAELIIKAVNNHDKLMNVLAELVQLGKWIPPETFTQQGLNDWKKYIKNAGELLEELKPLPLT